MNTNATNMLHLIQFIHQPLKLRIRDRQRIAAAENNFLNGRIASQCFERRLPAAFSFRRGMVSKVPTKTVATMNGAGAASNQ